MHRNSIGRFSKWNLRRKFYAGCMFVLVALVIYSVIGEGYVDGYLGYTQTYKGTPLAEAAELELRGDRLDMKIAELKKEVLDTLSKCESGGKEISIVFDTNAKPSIGIFQWQPQSYRYYFEKMSGVKLTEREAIVAALDDEKARTLAAWVIFSTDAGVGKDWFNCEKWHGLDAKVKVIKSLEQ